MLLEISGLHVHYNRVPALRNVSVEINEGEIVGVIGPNGAGKTTTLSAVVGTVGPHSGAIVFDGRSIVGLPPEKIVQLGIGLVPEGRRIFGTLTVGENLLIGTTALNDRTRTRDVVERMTDRFPILGKYFDVPAVRLSGGEQQQLAIARALVGEPRLLLLDEPSLGLAPRITDLVFEMMADLRDEGVTVLVVEQNALRTINLADRTYVLVRGSVAYAGTRAEAQEHLDIAEAYFGLEAPA